MNGNIIKSESNSAGTYPGEKELRYKGIWRSIGYLIALSIIVLSLIPNPERITPFSASDKLLHVLAYAFSMFWFGLCFNRDKLLIIGAGLIILGIILEIIQGQTGYRTMNLYDIIANCLGVFIGLILSFSRVSRSLQHIEKRFLK